MRSIASSTDVHYQATASFLFAVLTDIHHCPNCHVSFQHFLHLQRKHNDVEIRADAAEHTDAHGDASGGRELLLSTHPGPVIFVQTHTVLLMM